MRSIVILTLLLVCVYSARATQIVPRGGAWFGRKGKPKKNDIPPPAFVEKTRLSSNDKEIKRSATGSSTSNVSKKKRRVKKTRKQKMVSSSSHDSQGNGDLKHHSSPTRLVKARKTKRLINDRFPSKVKGNRARKGKKIQKGGDVLGNKELSPDHRSTSISDHDLDLISSPRAKVGTRKRVKRKMKKSAKYRLVAAEASLQRRESASERRQHLLTSGGPSNAQGARPKKLKGRRKKLTSSPIKEQQSDYDISNVQESTAEKVNKRRQWKQSKSKGIPLIDSSQILASDQVNTAHEEAKESLKKKKRKKLKKKQVHEKERRHSEGQFIPDLTDQRLAHSVTFIPTDIATINSAGNDHVEAPEYENELNANRAVPNVSLIGDANVLVVDPHSQVESETASVVSAHGINKSDASGNLDEIGRGKSDLQSDGNVGTREDELANSHLLGDDSLYHLDQNEFDDANGDFVVDDADCADQNKVLDELVESLIEGELDEADTNNEGFDRGIIEKASEKLESKLDSSFPLEDSFDAALETDPVGTLDTNHCIEVLSNEFSVNAEPDNYMKSVDTGKEEILESCINVVFDPEYHEALSKCSEASHEADAAYSTSRMGSTTKKNRLDDHWNGVTNEATDIHEGIDMAVDELVGRFSAIQASEVDANVFIETDRSVPMVSESLDGTRQSVRRNGHEDDLDELPMEVIVKQESSSQKEERKTISEDSVGDGMKLSISNAPMSALIDDKVTALIVKEGSGITRIHVKDMELGHEAFDGSFDMHSQQKPTNHDENVRVDGLLEFGDEHVEVDRYQPELIANVSTNPEIINWTAAIMNDNVLIEHSVEPEQVKGLDDIVNQSGLQVPLRNESTCLSIEGDSVKVESNETTDSAEESPDEPNDFGNMTGGTERVESSSLNTADDIGAIEHSVESQLSAVNDKLQSPSSDNQEPDGSAYAVVTDVCSLIDSGDDPSDITVSVVSWNLAEEVIPEKDAAFIRKFRHTPRCHEDGDDGSDIVLISSQECENIKPRRSEGHRSRELRRLMIKMLGKNYVPLAIHSLGGIQFGLFCKRSILSDIELVEVADVTCGIGNVFHNKGAIGAFLQMKARNPKSKDGQKMTMRRANSLKMLFVTAHLAAHVKNVDARNMDYWRIASELQAQAPARFLPTKPYNARIDKTGGTGSHLIDSVDRTFFCGDLNYRVDLPREISENSILSIKQLMKLGDDESLMKAEKLRLSLLLHDQLRQVIAQGAAFPGFAEGKIAFLPTFKFDKDTNDYDTSYKQRIPAWTDRVLFKPFGTRVLEYTSEENSKHSDHRPVHATFRVSTAGRDLTLHPRKGTTVVKRSKLPTN